MARMNTRGAVTRSKKLASLDLEEPNSVAKTPQNEGHPLPVTTITESTTPTKLSLSGGVESDTQDSSDEPHSPSASILAGSLADSHTPTQDGDPPPSSPKRGRPRGRKRKSADIEAPATKVEQTEGTTKRLRRTSARRASFSDGDEGEFIPNESQSVSAPNGTSSASASGKPEGKCKGLRHFSKIVCDKVQSKQTTTYNEVADELVAEFNQYTDADPDVDQKNIRRRVYDALNVLMAMNIISKEKKEIKWIGLPAVNVNDELRSLQAAYQAKLERVNKKREQLQELEAQLELYHKLIKRNSSPAYQQVTEKVYLPFIVVHTSKDTIINLDMSADRTEYFFDFSMPFTIYDDNEILRRMNEAGAFDNICTTTPPPTTPMPDLKQPRRRALPATSSLDSSDINYGEDENSSLLSSVRRKARQSLSEQSELMSNITRSTTSLYYTAPPPGR